MYANQSTYTEFLQLQKKKQKAQNEVTCAKPHISKPRPNT